MTQNILVISFLLTVTLCFGQQNDPVLFTVGDTPVHVSEFDYIYKKNNGDKADYSKESLQEYLDLYVKFKLKVAKAKQLKLDTIPSLQKELEGYRQQLANAYLVDKEVTKQLVDEAYDRKLQDVKVRHVLVSVPEKTSMQRNADAQDRVYLIKEKIDNGADFGLIAKTLSDDKRSAKNDGELGWLTAMFPNGFYEFENAIYNLPIGETSQPIRTKIGYHLIQVMDRRPARGEISVSHILIKKAKNGKVVPQSMEVADSLYMLIKDGASFDKIAKTKSEDKSTSKENGDLGYFGIGMYDINFENAAFSLQNDGDITPPIESKLGWHIIRRDAKKDYSNVQKMKSTLRREISQKDRFASARRSKIEEIKSEAGFTENTQALDNFASLLNVNFYSYKWTLPESSDTQLANFGDEAVYTIADFAKYCKDNGRQRMRFDKKKPIPEAVQEMYSSFIDDKTIAYEKANLERKYPDFKALMREYSEGVLLFEVTKNNVWDKASQDTIGLQSYFNQNRDKYQWPERADFTEYTIETTDKTILKKLGKAAEKLSPDEVKRQIETEFDQTVFVEQNKYDKTNPSLTHMKWKKGQQEVIIDKVNSEASVRRIDAIIPAGPKTLKEARGYIISDYQDILEKEWVDSLRREFVVDIKSKILSSLVK